MQLDANVRRFCETYTSGANDPDGADALAALCAAILHREGLARLAIEVADLGHVPVEGAVYSVMA